MINAYLILYHTFIADDGVEYILNIYDTVDAPEYSGPFATVKDSIIVTTNGDDKDPFKRIYTTDLKFTMLLNHPRYTTEEKDQVIGFYEGLVTSPEGRYYCALAKNDLSTNILFMGKIIADIGDLKMAKHKVVQITAHDGIKQLEGIEFRPTDYDDRVPESLIYPYTFVQLFEQILSKNDVAKVFHENTVLPATPMMTISTNWTESGLTTQPVLEKIMMKNHYFEEVSSTYRKYENCLTVLEDLLTGFNMRLYFSRGSWHIEQLGYQDNANVSRYTYDYYGERIQLISNKVTNNVSTNDDIKVIGIHSVGYIAPLKAVKLLQNKKYTNVLGGLDMFLSPAGSDNRGPHNLGYTFSGGKELIMDLWFRTKILSPLTHTFYIEFIWELEIKVGDLYLKSLDADGAINLRYISTTELGVTKDDGTFGYLEYEWTYVASTVKFRTLKVNSNFGGPAVDFLNLHNTGIKGFSIECPLDGEFSIELVSATITTQNQAGASANDTSKLDFIRLLKKSRISFVTNGKDGFLKVPDDTVIYEIGDTRNSIVYEAKLRYFDSPDQYALRQLYRITQPFPLLYTPTAEWTDADMSETLPIQELLLSQMLSMRAVPSKVIKCTLRHTSVMYLLDRYAWDGQQHIPLSWSHAVDKGEYNVALWQVYKDFPGKNVFRDNTNDDAVAVFPTSTQDSYSPPRLGVEYWEEWYDVNANYVIMASYNSGLVDPEDLYAIRSTHSLYINGVKQRYVLPSESIINRTWSFDTDNIDRIKVFKAREPISHIEFIKNY